MNVELGLARVRNVGVGVVGTRPTIRTKIRTRIRIRSACCIKAPILTLTLIHIAAVYSVRYHLIEASYSA